MPAILVSTVGTSLLTNALKQSAPDRVKEVLDHANDSEDTIPDSVEDMARETMEQAVADLQGANDEAIRRASAELNGLLGWYREAEPEGHAQHWLIATDTALGRITAEGVKRILENWGVDAVQIHVPHGLSTKNTDALKGGVKRFLNWCEDSLPGYQDRGYEVVFNLTGGFKSLQGILNTVGMFYADRMIYIFQRGPELITIPRLPVALDTEVFEKSPARFLRLEALNHVPKGTLSEKAFLDVPGALLDAVDGRVYSFSEWGILVWNRKRRDLLGREVPFDFPRLQYSRRFRSDVKKATPAQRRRLHETLALVSVLLSVHDGDTAPLKQHGALRYEPYEGKTTQDGQPIGHFRMSTDREGRRVSCRKDGKTLRLRRFGRHDEVNASP